MRVVFVHINQVEISSGSPRLFFVRVTLQSQAAPAGGTKANQLQLTLRTDISTEPTLTPSFRLSKLHFKLPALPPAANDKKKPQQQPSNDQHLMVTLDVYEISPDAGPRLVGSAKSNVAALVDSAPPLALISAPGSDAVQQAQVGVIKATARAFSGPTNTSAQPGNGIVVSDVDDMHDGNTDSDLGEYGSANGSQLAGGSRIDTSEAYAEPGQCGKRLALTIVSLRNVHAFKNSALSFAVMTGTAVKTKSAPVLVTGSGEVMHLGLSLSCIVDTTYSPTTSTLTTLVLFERDKPRAKFHLTLHPPLTSQSWSSHAQLATVLKCSSASSSGASAEGLEVHVLLSTLDLTIASPALLIRPLDSGAAPSTVITLDIKTTTGPLPIPRSGRCLLHVQTLTGSGAGTADAFLHDMMSSASTSIADRLVPSVAPRHLAKFPIVTFDGSGTPTCTWPPAPPSIKAHAKYIISDPGRSSITDNAPVSFHRRMVLVAQAGHDSPVASLAFQLFAVVSPGHEYVLVAYGTLEMDPAGPSGRFPHHLQHSQRVRLFPTMAYRTVFATANCGRLYLDVSVHAYQYHGHDKAQSSVAKRGQLVGDEALVDLPLLEPPSQNALLDEFQDMAKAIMDLRLEKQRLARDCARLEAQRENGGTTPGDAAVSNELLQVTTVQLNNMARDQLIEYCLGTQNALRAAHAAEAIKRADAAKLQTHAETTQILQDQIRHLQDTVSKQQVQLQELQLFRKKSERLKALVHQQETVIQHLERLTSSSSFQKNSNTSNESTTSVQVGSQPDIELLMRCSKAESRVAALEKQILDLSGRIAAAKVGAGNAVAS